MSASQTRHFSGRRPIVSGDFEFPRARLSSSSTPSVLAPDPSTMAVAAAYLFLFASILASLLAGTSQAQPVSEHSSSLIGQLHEAKLKLARLESDFEQIARDVEARDRGLEESGNQIEEMEKKLVDLQAAHTKLKDELSAGDGTIIALEKEIRDLWDTLRKNNFDIHVLKLKAEEYDTFLDTLTSHVEKVEHSYSLIVFLIARSIFMAFSPFCIADVAGFLLWVACQAENIVAERWILIQQFEQALQLLDMRVMKARKQRYSRCTFLKYINDLNGKHISKAIQTSKRFGEESGFSSYISSTLEQLKRLYSTVKEFHFELQSLVRQIMVDYEFTESMANDEVVFFVASALLVFPVLSAWVLLSSHLL
ncbi:unnamed protein product [Linum tenue]|uniref:Uncharacterized protein n=1 Tax=Linum tenue TaxID=586396 RepID=A0AAV0PDB3_9ROSI|nr:unnamed protein product [Linum tenue]